jgi:hypothetical protein
MSKSSSLTQNSGFLTRINARDRATPEDQPLLKNERRCGILAPS